MKLVILSLTTLASFALARGYYDCAEYRDDPLKNHYYSFCTASGGPSYNCNDHPDIGPPRSHVVAVYGGEAGDKTLQFGPPCDGSEQSYGYVRHDFIGPYCLATHWLVAYQQDGTWHRFFLDKDDSCGIKNIDKTPQAIEIFYLK